VTARRLGAGDEERLAAAALAHYDSAASREWLTAVLDDPAVLAVAVFDDERAVGLAYGYLLPRVKRDEVAFLLYEIDVAEDHRRLGHGQAMVRELLDWASERGADESWLLTDDGNPAAVALYESAGGDRHSVPQVMFTFRRE